MSRLIHLLTQLIKETQWRPAVINMINNLIG
jgi:hypothetical protein